MIRLIHYRPRLWVVLFAANLTLVLLPFIGIVFSGVIETQRVRTVERELRLQAVQLTVPRALQGRQGNHDSPRQVGQIIMPCP